MTFQFSDKKRIISILDKEYSVEQGDIESLSALNNVSNKIAGLHPDNFEDKIDFIKSVADVIEKFLDDIFGQGTYVEIFSGRRQNIVDMMELIEYISAEFNRIGVVKNATTSVAEIVEVADDEPASS